MANFETEEIVTTVRRLSQLQKEITLTAGQKLTDDADLVAFAQKTVPTGKVAIIDVTITVKQLRSA